MKIDLENTLTEVAGGSEPATQRLAKALFPSGHRMAKAMLGGDEALAEDAVQNAFVVLTQKLHQVRDPHALRGWWRQVVRTQCTRILRSQRESVAEVEQHAGTAAGPDAVFETEELHRFTRAAVNSLPATTRQSAELYYFQECSVLEVAQQLGKPQGSVKRHLYQAREQLRPLLLGYLKGNPSPAIRLHRDPDVFSLDQNSLTTKEEDST